MKVMIELNEYKNFKPGFFALYYHLYEPLYYAFKNGGEKELNRKRMKLYSTMDNLEDMKVLAYFYDFILDNKERIVGEKTNLDESVRVHSIDFDAYNNDLLAIYNGKRIIYELTGTCSTWGMTAYSGKFNLVELVANSNGTILGITKKGSEFILLKDDINTIVNGVKSGQNVIELKISGEVGGIKGKCFCKLSKR